jgi:hypothetical protein
VIKTLVSIEVDLVSSLAVRFACQLSGLMEMEINPVYVKESAPHESAMGAGWASRTWEKEMVQEGKEEIADLITAELDFCPVLKEPSVIYGDRETELLKVMSADGFGLYVEGVSFSWTQADILKRLHTKLYQGMAPPMIFVRTLRKVNNVLLLCLDVEGTRALTTVFQRIWKTDSVPLSLTYPAEDTAKTRELKDEVERSRVLLADSGCAVDVREGLGAGPDTAEALKDQGLVAISAGRHIKKDSPELQWLNLIKTSALLVFH